MDKKIIEKILLDNLVKIDDNDFNYDIINKLNFSKKKEKLVLFNEKIVVKTFIIIALFVLIINTDLIEYLSLSHLLIGMFISLIPLYLLLFNKIYQVSNKGAFTSN